MVEPVDQEGVDLVLQANLQLIELELQTLEVVEAVAHLLYHLLLQQIQGLVLVVQV